MVQDLKSVFGHRGEDIKEGLTIKGKIQEQWVLGRRRRERVAGEENIKQTDADSPNISLCGVVRPSGGIVLLRRHIAVAANASLIGKLLNGGEPEISELHGTILGEENILGLDIAVIDALGVHVLD